jgi:cephalosporin-C deacetylase-like acetyl esterase
MRKIIFLLQLLTAYSINTMAQVVEPVLPKATVNQQLDNCYTPFYADRTNIVSDPEVNDLANYSGGTFGVLPVTDPALVFCGQKCCMIVGQRTGGLGYALAGKIFPNTTYQVKAKVNVTSGFDFGTLGTGPDVLTPIPVSNGWKDYTYTFTTGSTLSASPIFYFNNWAGNTSGTGYFDNIELYAMSSVTIKYINQFGTSIKSDKRLSTGLTLGSTYTASALDKITITFGGITYKYDTSSVDKVVVPQGNGIISLKFSSPEPLPNYGPYKLYSSCNFDIDGRDSLGNNNILLKNATIVDDPIHGKVVSISKSKTGFLQFEKTPIRTDTFTVSLWYYWDQENAGAQWQSIFIFTRSDVVNTHLYLTSSAFSPATSLLDGSNSVASVWQSVKASSSPLASNQWNHFAVTIEGTKATTYLNGVLVATGTITPTPKSIGADKFFFGVDTIFGKNPQTAKYDDIKIFHKSLAFNQIKALYLGNPIPEPIPIVDFSKLPLSIVVNDADYIFLGSNPIKTSAVINNTLGTSTSVIVKQVITTDDFKPVRIDSVLATLNPGINTINFSYSAAPGFYRYSANLEKEGFKGEVKSIILGYEPEKIVSPVDTMPGFTQFWADTRAELNAVLPNYVVTKDASLSSAARNVYVVEMTSFKNERIKGYFAAPNRAGKFPVNMLFMGYGVDPFAPSKTDNGFCEFIVSARGQGLNVPTGQNKFQGKFGDYLTYGLDSKENYFYRGAFMDLIRAVDFVCTRAEVDTSKIVAQGFSQGGAYTYAVSALDKRIKACVPKAPFLSDYRDYFNIVTWPRSNFETYLAAHPESSWEKIYSLLTFFDIKNLAGNIKCPLLMYTGVQDPTCPDHINFSAFNQVKSQKEYRSYPLIGHWEITEFNDFSWQWINSKLAALPNSIVQPTSDKFTVISSSDKGVCNVKGSSIEKIRVFNEIGSEQHASIQYGKEQCTISMTGFKSGFYLVLIQKGSIAECKKVLF